MSCRSASDGRTMTRLAQTNWSPIPADGYGRLARQPAFDGAVRPGADYVFFVVGIPR